MRKNHWGLNGGEAGVAPNDSFCNVFRISAPNKNRDLKVTLHLYKLYLDGRTIRILDGHQGNSKMTKSRPSRVTQ